MSNLLVLRVVFAFAMAACLSLPIAAQWSEVRTKGVPRTAAGEVNLNAPAPTLASGKTPDLSGIWRGVSVPCPPDFPFGCTDIPLGIPIGALDISATRPEELESGIAGGLPMQPWARALYQERLATFSAGDLISRCLPVPGPRQWGGFLFQKIVQSPEAVIVLD